MFELFFSVILYFIGSYWFEKMDRDREDALADCEISAMGIKLDLDDK